MDYQMKIFIEVSNIKLLSAVEASPMRKIPQHVGKTYKKIVPEIL